MPFLDTSVPGLRVSTDEFENLPAGRYVVTGVRRFASADESGVPVFKPSKFDGSLQASLGLSVEGQTLDAMFSGDRLALCRLAYAFGVDVHALPAGNTSEFLMALEKAVNASGKRVPVYVNKNGWVRDILSLAIFPNLYKLSVISIHSIDGTQPVTFKLPLKWKGNPVVRVNFRIEGAASGDSTIWDGHVISQYVATPFDGVGTTPDGKRCPKFRVTWNGAKPVDVTRFERFLNAYWPEAYDYEWVSEPSRSIYGVDEAANPIVVIASQVVNGKRVASGFIKDKDGRAVLDMDTLNPIAVPPKPPIPAVPSKPSKEPEFSEPSEGFVPETPVSVFISELAPEAPNPFASPAVSEVSSRVTSEKALLELIEGYAKRPLFVRVSGTNAILPNPIPDGVEWLRQNIAPVWDELGLPQPRKIGSLDKGQLDALFNALKDKWNIEPEVF
jgi:hypothetical protein